MREWLRRKAARRWLRAFVWIVVLVVVLRWFEHSQVYYPSASLACTGEALGRPWEDVRFTAADGTRLHGWFFPGDTNSVHGRKAFLLCHGNAGNISHRLDTYELLLRSGASVFAFDYRGYGCSKGRPSEQGTYLDGRAALEWLVNRGFKAAGVFLYGESLGGGIATELALQEAVGGLILVSSYTSIAAIGQELFPWLPVKWISTIQYDTLSKLPRVRVPVLVMHSKTDTLIGFHHAQRNFAVANEPKMLWEIDGDHNDPMDGRAEVFLKGLAKFMRRCEDLQSKP